MAKMTIKAVTIETSTKENPASKDGLVPTLEPTLDNTTVSATCSKFCVIIFLLLPVALSHGSVGVCVKY
jgi:hypothetical protein